ncbi:Rpn family recombination-promoting nuclease/putative transposase [Nocardia yunnanensis]|nr:Rpn family recombination-promoting nuclease/putative transposase [Nocardia yunnanensis]
MADSPSNPHDAYFRHVLARPADIAGELRAVLPTEIAARIDWGMLALQPCSFVSQHLRSRYSDLLFRTRLDGQEAFVYLLVEHQSRPDRMMPLRMMEYLVAIWNRYIRDDPDEKMLPAIIPLVVHASPEGRPWLHPTELSELVDIDPATRAALGDHLPRFRFLLDDLTAVDLPTLGPAAKEVIMTTAERLRAEGEARGRAEGEARGRAEGEARGRAETLIEQLSLKFGEVPSQAADTIRSGELSQLRTWAARVITATSIEEVFGE